jgi:hypothetical protein
MAQVVERLPKKHEALSSNHSTIKESEEFTHYSCTYVNNQAKSNKTRHFVNKNILTLPIFLFIKKGMTIERSVCARACVHVGNARV